MKDVPLLDELRATRQRSADDWNWMRNAMRRCCTASRRIPHVSMLPSRFCRRLLPPRSHIQRGRLIVQVPTSGRLPLDFADGDLERLGDDDLACVHGYLLWGG